MNPFKVIGILIMWVYDMLMLPFVLIFKLLKSIWFVVVVVIVCLILWGMFIA